jgi:hypothetical protein
MLKVEAAVLDGLQFDASPFGQDGFAAPEVDVGRGEVNDALVVAVGVVVVDEGGDGCLKFALKEVVFQQDAVLQGLVPSFDLALGLSPLGDCEQSPAGYPGGVAGSKLATAAIERRLAMTLTARNWNTVLRLSRAAASAP